MGHTGLYLLARTNYKAPDNGSSPTANCPIYQPQIDSGWSTGKELVTKWDPRFSHRGSAQPPCGTQKTVNYEEKNEKQK